MKEFRQSNFKIGTFHGTLKPVVGSKEAKLRNALYLIGNLNLPFTRKEGTKIRLIGYEIPIENKGKRIDLIGYDKDMNPWIIELKADNSQEKISDIVKQIEGYSKILPALINLIESEFYEKFFINLKLSNKIRKIIIAPREFFAKHDKSSYPKLEDVFLCSIANVKEVFNENDELTFDAKFNQFDEITLKIENR